MPATEDVQRQIAVTIVVTVEEPILLLAVQRIVGRVEVDDDLLRRPPVRGQEQRDEPAPDRRRVVADLVIARRRPRRRVLQPVQRRLAGERRAVRPPRLELAGEHRHHRIMAQLVVVDQVLVTQRQGEHTLADQRRDAVLRQRRIAAVLETSRKPRDQANRPLRGPQQKRAAVRRHRTAVKRCLNAPALNACKSEQIRDTLCWHRGDPPSQLKFLLQQSLSLIRGPDALLRVRNPG